MLARPQRHEGDPAALIQTAGPRAQQRGLSAAGGAEMIVTFFSAA
jgi:hypothetical protein